MENKGYIQNFWELDVYKRLRKLRKVIITKVIPKLPQSEKYDLACQMQRACKSACAILAEGFAKRFQERHWKKYLTDSVGECNEMLDHLSVIEDIYQENINRNSIMLLINEYRICVRQLITLSRSWLEYHKKKQNLNS